MTAPRQVPTLTITTAGGRVDFVAMDKRQPTTISSPTIMLSGTLWLDATDCRIESVSSPGVVWTRVGDRFRGVAENPIAGAVTALVVPL